MPYLVEGSQPPDHDAIKLFYEQACSDHPDHPVEYQIRWIGGDHDSTEAILGHILTGDKTGTVSLPEVAEKRGCDPSKPGDTMVLIHFDGSPAAVLKIVDVETVAYQDIQLKHTSLDGPAVRPLEIWLPVHTPYFERLLASHQLSLTDETPIWFETFELIYPKVTP